VTEYRRTEAEAEFLAWLDSVATDTTAWKLADPTEVDIPMRTYLRKERYRRQWIESQDWWQRSQEAARRLDEAIANEQLQFPVQPNEVIANDSTPGFWQQFRS
jgi:hypothetical protein